MTSVLLPLLISLNLSDWQKLRFEKIKEHQLTQNGMEMKIDVNSSAMPLIYPLKLATEVKRVCVEISLNGDLRLKDSSIQGQKKWDDFRFRFGLVREGNQTLSWGKKLFAAEWVKKLFSLGKEYKGIKDILFLNLLESPEQLGQSRKHPLSDLIEERYVWVKKPDKWQFLEYEFEQPQKVIALWLSSDGDDTKSTFSLNIRKIELNCKSDKK